MQSPHPKIPCVCLALLCGLGQAVAQQSRYSTTEFEAINNAFREHYASARLREVAAAGPIILATGDRLLLLHQDRRQEGSQVHTNYHDLKTLAHLPLTVFCLTKSLVEDPADESMQRRMQSFAESMSALDDALSVAFTEPKQVEAQRRLLEKCRALLTRAMASGRVTSEVLDEFAEAVRPAIIANARQAVRLRIDNYQQQMLIWRGEMAETDWERLSIIVPGASLSRANSLAVSYFGKVLEQSGEGGRLIYAESRSDEEQAIELLGTHLLDAQIGEVFFDDVSRMKRDLLGPHANVYLDSLDFDAFRPRSGGADRK